ncbi:PP2C family protein-serine/threonine phosphatase [Streptacidiphilus griseoplanus]|uniref:PP2C family protein-serine/threonine phosphatase n=1 Tax=Peterkaempfera griseoplana TaxID=66896 RepID=UPI0006E33279|nr:GAF domain-containing SpoIIE family protein phosphatase [Peterkaempfera griseoplana]
MDPFEVDAVLQRGLERLTLLTEVTMALSGTLDAREGLRRVCRILVPQLADWCAVDLMEETGRPYRVCVTHRQPSVLPRGGLAGPLPPPPSSPTGPLSRVLAGAGPLLVHPSDMPPPEEARDPLHARDLELYARLGGHSLVVAPLRVRRQTLGALTVARCGDREPLGPMDLTLVEDLTHRIALAVDNARLHSETSHIAERLQRSLLPDLPRKEHLQISARYQPSRASAEVGGDWYDSFTLPNSDTTLIIGDVSGHDLRAAVTMSQLRNMLRGIACDRQEPPGVILHRLDLAHVTLDAQAATTDAQATATCVYALLKGPPGGPWDLHWASAGHLPPLLITPGGDTRYLEEAHGLLLGVDPQSPRSSAATPLPTGCTVLLYTDGLIERRGESLDQGLTRLRRHAAAFAREPVDVMCDGLVAALAAEAADDVALLAVRLLPTGTHDAALP